MCSTILELNMYQRLEDKKKKMNIGRQVLTSSKQLQNRSFHVVDSKRTTAQCT